MNMTYVEKKSKRRKLMSNFECEVVKIMEAKFKELPNIEKKKVLQNLIEYLDWKEEEAE